MTWLEQAKADVWLAADHDENTKVSALVAAILRNIEQPDGESVSVAIDDLTRSLKGSVSLAGANQGIWSLIKSGQLEYFVAQEPLEVFEDMRTGGLHVASWIPVERVRPTNTFGQPTNGQPQSIKTGAARGKRRGRLSQQELDDLNKEANRFLRMNPRASRDQLASHLGVGGGTASKLSAWLSRHPHHPKKGNRQRPSGDRIGLETAVEHASATATEDWQSPIDDKIDEAAELQHLVAEQKRDELTDRRHRR